MNILAWMLTRMVAARFLAILLGVSVFVLSLEVLSYVDDILALRPGHMSIIFDYVLARAPSVLSTYLPLSILLATLLVLTELSYRNEITALWSSGLSPSRLLLQLLPLALLAGGLHFLLNDMAIPRQAPQLRAWAIGDYGKETLKVGEKDPIWMRAGPDILRARSASADSSELRDVIIFRRDGTGLLREQVYAGKASHSGARWNLEDVTVYYRENLAPNHLDAMVYSGALKPAAAGARSGAPEEMSLVELGFFIDNAGFGIRPVWVYQTGWHKRISLFFSALLMISLCIPLAGRFRRGGGLGALFAVGVGLGFVYFVADGIAMTMGELGFVTPWLAAWLPVIGFAALAAVLTLRGEQV